MYEKKSQPLASPKKFRHRLFRNGLWALAFLGFSLLIGVLGYKYTCGFGWVDSLLNASMILGGMGPVDIIKEGNNAGKIFASFYAIYCGVALLTSIGVLFTPVLHRVYHRFHMEEDDD